MKIYLKLVFMLVLATGLLFSCKDEPLPTPEPEEETSKEEAPELTQKVNKFFKDGMELYYFWNKELPDIDIRYEFDSEAYFDKLLYKDDDLSYVVDNVNAYEDGLSGVAKSYGWSLTFGRFSNTGNIFAIVEYVYPNTPAARAGIKRGDLIVLMNSNDITDDNYRQLLGGENINISLGILGENGISVGGEKTLSAEELNLNPVVVKKVIEQGGHKIGYLFYARYVSGYNTSLDSAFQYFLDQGITDLVLDLRYNGGGYNSTLQHLCSSIAPLSAVNSESILATYQYNDILTDYFKENNLDNNLKLTFKSTVPVKMGLDKIHVLTGSGTASASELTITGLSPYMSVKTVGESTYGKYTGSWTLKPEDIYESKSYYDEINNWGLIPVIFKYANALGVTDFKDGFAPDIPVDDDLFDVAPLGQKDEPLLKAAIEDITGEELVAVKKARKPIPNVALDPALSRYKDIERVLISDGFNKQIPKFKE